MVTINVWLLFFFNSLDSIIIMILIINIHVTEHVCETSIIADIQYYNRAMHFFEVNRKMSLFTSAAFEKIRFVCSQKVILNWNSCSNRTQYFLNENQFTWPWILFVHWTIFIMFTMYACKINYRSTQVFFLVFASMSVLSTVLQFHEQIW